MVWKISQSTPSITLQMIKNREEWLVQGCARIQRDPDRLEKWVDRNFMNKGKC